MAGQSIDWLRNWISGIRCCYCSRTFAEAPFADYQSCCICDVAPPI